MKKFLLTVLTGILLITGITACSEKDNMNSDIVIFSQKGCPHCVHAMAFINGELKKTFPDISVAEYDINENRHNYELFAHTARRFQLGDRIGTPLIVVGDNYIMGWTTENQNKLTQFINKHRAQKETQTK